MIVIHGTGERRPTASLLPYARNSRLHSDEQIEQIAASMREWGFTNPVIVDIDGEIIAGHGRVQAAHRNECEECPVVTVSGWSEAQKRAYVIADNKLALNATWDDKMLAAELADLSSEDFDVGVIGFTDEELLDLTVSLETDPEPTRRTSDDAAAALPEHSTSRRGDVWVLGAHRLVVGNPLQHDVMQQLLRGDRAQLVLLAPERDQVDAQGLASVIDEYSTGWAIVWIDWRDVSRWLQETRSLGLPSSMLVWHKGGGALGDIKRTFSSDFELGLVWHRGAELVGRRVGSVWKAAKDKGGDFSSAKQRPVSLAVQAIERTTAAGALVLDLAGRDGSSVIACEKTGRAARVVEIDERYADVIVQRWEAFADGRPILEATGQSWAVVEAERRGGAGGRGA